MSERSTDRFLTVVIVAMGVGTVLAVALCMASLTARLILDLLERLQ